MSPSIDILGMALTAGSVLLFGACALFLSVFVYNNIFAQLARDMKAESGATAGQVTLRRMGTFNRRLMWPGYEARLRKLLTQGGDPKGYKPEDVLSLQEMGFVSCLIFGLLMTYLLKLNLVWSFILAAGGGLYPLIWVRDQVKKRHHLILRALPYNLDLLTLSVEAGLDFTAGLAKVVEKGKVGPLRDELELVLKQLKMGKTREEALKLMVQRVDMPALSQFITALIQADRMGTSLGKVLRIQSTQLRLDRSQRAEKAANEAPVKMLFPLIACIFPTVFMVLFGPIIFKLVVEGL